MQYRYVAPHPFGELPRWGAKNVLPLTLIALPARGADDTGIPSAKMAAKPPPEPVEPLGPSEPVEPHILKAGMSGFEWLVTTYHFRASPFIKIDAKLCIKILANADPAIESAFP